MKKFDEDRKGTGTAEWAEVNENICRGCPNDCLYCYAAANAKRFKQRERKDWHIEEFTKRARMKSYPAKDGVIMFPSAHDITPFNVDEYIRVAKLILEKGNKLLIVSKPRMECIAKLVGFLCEYTDQILFRFTIGSMSSRTTSFWEPGAPLPDERLQCLKLAAESGYKTSVSIEPMLSGIQGAENVVFMVKPFITDTIWIGKMNKTRLRVDMTNPDNIKRIEDIERLQCDEEILKLYSRLKNEPMIRWKDSIKAVVSETKTEE
jgi:DNA repair photolyase